MAQELRFKLDGTFYQGIANPEDFGFRVAEETTLNYRYVSFDNDLRFIGDAYAYLNGLILGSCGCDIVSVEVEYLCQVSWRRLCTGFIILSECVNDLDRCSITTKIYDNTFSTLINNNKNIPFSLRCETTKNGEAITPPDYKTTVMYVPATGAYETTDVIYSIRVEDAFKHLVGCMTDNLVDCEAPAFASGTFEFTAVTNGRQIYTPLTEVETVVTFEQLFLALQRKLNISLSASLQSNGRPLLTIDFADNINNLSINADLINVGGVIRKEDTAQLYSVVNFGNADVFEQWECNGGENPCTFAQTPFLGYRDEKFGLIGKCNKDTILDLLVNEVVFDTNIIEDIYVWGNQSYDNNPIIIDCEEGLAGRIVAKQGDPYNIGQTVYNAEFNNESTAGYWINSVPNSLQSYIEGFNPSDTGMIVKFDGSSANETLNEIEIIQTSYTSVSQIYGRNLIWLDTSLDTNNLYTLDSYVCPYDGIYTFNAGVILDELRNAVAPFNPVGTEFGRDAILHIEKRNALDEFVTRQSFAFSGTSANYMYGEINNVQFVLEQGNKVSVNIEVKKATGDDTLMLQRFLDAATVNGTPRESFFNAIGEPFEPGELQPYDPCDFKKYLYDFEQPLTMEQIEDILTLPSGRIRMSREESLLNGITGTINNLTVNSVIRQKGQFTLRSNQAL